MLAGRDTNNFSGFEAEGKAGGGGEDGFFGAARPRVRKRTEKQRTRTECSCSLPIRIPLSYSLSLSLSLSLWPFGVDTRIQQGELPVTPT